MERVNHRSPAPDAIVAMNRYRHLLAEKKRLREELDILAARGGHAPSADLIGLESSLCRELAVVVANVRSHKAREKNRRAVNLAPVFDMPAGSIAEGFASSFEPSLHDTTSCLTNCATDCVTNCTTDCISGCTSDCLTNCTHDCQTGCTSGCTFSNAGSYVGNDIQATAGAARMASGRAGIDWN